jgi:hypothetical protein
MHPQSIASAADGCPTAPRLTRMVQPVQPPANCLFCGSALTDSPTTREHVFPQWLQRRYDLSNLSLVLLNGTAIRYRQLVVPACEGCNSGDGSRLEQRVREQRASPVDSWIWLLKLSIGTMYFETGRPLERDQRLPESKVPIFDHTALELKFLQALFDTLKRPDPQFLPNPLGSIFSFPTDPDRFHYADKLYQHPDSRHDGNYLAACVCALGRCMIALFDDAGTVARSVNVNKMQRSVSDGKDPVVFFPELMYQRARLDYLPDTLVIGPKGGPAGGVMFVPPMHEVPVLDHDEEVLRDYYVACGHEVYAG